ncbi:MAG: hypothetical protein EOO87_16475 [Pedobacter sp.]|nr:MAG: hypothetical protein EOO87_16475 [Pedobacter sp.]
MVENDEFANEKLDFAKLAPILNGDKSNLVSAVNESAETIVIFSRHRYYRHLVVEMASVTLTKAGKLKNPLQFLDPLDLVWKTEKHEEVKFFTGDIPGNFKVNVQGITNIGVVSAQSTITVLP